MAASVATAALATPVAKAAAEIGKVSNFRVRTKRGPAGELSRVAIETSDGRWLIDASQFAGNPKLEYRREGKTAVVRLTEARFPGTDFKVNLEATISSGLLGNTIQVRFWDTGVSGTSFEGHANLQSWLKGEAKLVANLETQKALDLLIGSNTFGNAGICKAQRGQFEYLASGACLFEGNAELVTPSGRFSTERCHWASISRSADSLVPGKDRCHSQVTATIGHDLDHIVELACEDWKVSGSSQSASKLVLECHEQGATAVAVFGTTGLIASLPGHLEFGLQDVLYAKLHGDDEDEFLSARFEDQEQWLHAGGTSVLLAPVADSTVTVRRNRAGDFVADAPLEARVVSPNIEDSIVQLGQKAINANQVDLGAFDTKLTDVGELQIMLTTRGSAELSILRARDLLNLQFHFINFNLLANGSGTFAVKADPKLPSYVAITFPPQSVAETSIPQAQGSPEQALPPLSGPVQTLLSNPTRLVFFVPANLPPIKITLDEAGGLLDWDNWTLNVNPTAVSSYATVALDPNWVSPMSSSLKQQFGKKSFRAPARGAALGAEISSGGKSPAPAAAMQSRSTGQSKTPSKLEDEFFDISLQPVSTNVNPALTFTVVPNGRKPLDRFQTNIEMPFWLNLSPNEQARFLHSRRADTSIRARGAPVQSVLWHTQLGSWYVHEGKKTLISTSDDGRWFYAIGADGVTRTGPFPSPTPFHPTVRSVDSVDFEQPMMFGSVDGPHRKALVQSMTPRSTNAVSDSRPFVVQHLMLTALGGFLKGHWGYRNGTLSTEGNEPPSPNPNPTTVSWTHSMSLGRDHYSEVTDRGFIFPTMQGAVLVTITERKFQHDSGNRYYAVLRTRKFVVVTEPTVSFNDAQARKLGFKSITCATKKSVNLDVTPGSDTRWLKSNGKQVTFAMQGVDHDGKIITWDQPVGFVRNSEATSATLPLTPNAPGPSPLLGGQLIAFAPSSITPKGSGTRFPCESFTLTASSAPANLSAGIPNFMPYMSGATIRVSALEQFQTDGKKAPPVQVQYAPIYLSNGFGSGNPSEVLFVLSSKFVAIFSDTSKLGGIASPNMQIGALSRSHGPIPGVPGPGGFKPSDYAPPGTGVVQNESDTLWAAADLLDVSTAAAPDPLSVAKLLGAVSLWDLLPDSIDVGGDGTAAPKIVLQKLFSDGTGGKPIEEIGVRASMDWNPTLKNWPKGSKTPIFVADTGSLRSSGDPNAPFKGKPSDYNNETPAANAAFKITSYVTTIFKSSGEEPPPGEKPDPLKTPGVHYEAIGDLSWFRLDIVATAVSVIYVDVQRIKFTARSGEPAKVQIDIPQIVFAGPLSFVNVLQQYLGGGDNSVHYPSKVGEIEPSELLALNGSTNLSPAYAGAGLKPFMSIDSNGITTGFTLTIPDISIGVFALSNISLTSQLILPFIGSELVIEFDFCTRDHPFALSVYGITGGGFFGLAVSPSGLKRIEAALEFGASVSINLGVASGSVSIMAGIYFKLENQSDGSRITTLTGYVRLSGELDVIGIITISVEFYLGLTYVTDGHSDKVAGDASLTVEVSVLFFHKSVEISVHKEFAGGGGGSHALMASNNGAFGTAAAPTVPFTEAVTQSLWADYCAAFGGQ